MNRLWSDLCESRPYTSLHVRTPFTPTPLKIEALSIPQFHFPLKHQTVISLNTIWRLLASAPHSSQTLINVTGVYSFFLLFYFLQNLSALWLADIHLIFGELSSAGRAAGSEQLTVIKSRQSQSEVWRALPEPSPHQAAKGVAEGELEKNLAKQRLQQPATQLH